MSALAFCIIMFVVALIAALAGSKLAQRMLGIVAGIVLVIGFVLWLLHSPTPV